jgi:V8-like Glu-specific endopeptidase
MTDLLPNISPTAEFALLDIGTFGGNSGSGVYLIDEQGKRHLIGVVSAGVSDYTAVALF